MFASSGIISATTFFGDGENLSNLIKSKLEGVSIFNDTTQVGSNFQFSTLKLDGSLISAVGVGLTATISIDTTPTFTDLNVSGISTLGSVKISSGIVTAVSGVVTYYGDGSNLTGAGSQSDADNNLIAGNNAGGSYDPATGTACQNIFLGSNSGLITEGDDNIFLGQSAGCSNTTGSQNNFIGRNAGLSNTTGLCNNMIGSSAGSCATVTGSHNTFLGTYAGKCATSTGLVITSLVMVQDVATALEVLTSSWVGMQVPVTALDVVML